jgi:hypothetical protein
MSKRFYNNTPKGRTEIDLRQEFNNMMDGVPPEIAKARKFVLRKMRRQESEPQQNKIFAGRKQNIDYYVPNQGYLIVCDCVDKITQEPDLDSWCPSCSGEGYLWDEVIIDGYKALLRGTETLIGPGLSNIPLTVFYLRSHILITKADKLVELWLDEEGKIMRPRRRKAIYRISEATDLRADFGRIEYWRVDCSQEQYKFLNGPKE